MTPASIAYYFFIGAAGISATGILFTRNVFHAVLMLLVTLLSVAALYIMSGAEFLGVAQILVYAGGVIILLIFGIMLTSRLSNKPLQIGNHNLFGGLLASGALLTVLLFSYQHLHLQPANDLLTFPEAGVSLMTDFAVAFETSGMLLLVSLIGAAMVASTNFKRHEP